MAHFFDLARGIRTLTDMLYDPGFWLFGLAVGLLFLGILGVILSTRRVPSDEAPPVAAPGSEETRLHELEAEVERLRAEAEELRDVLGRLAVLLERRSPARPGDPGTHLVTTGDDRARRAGDG